MSAPLLSREDIKTILEVSQELKRAEAEANKRADEKEADERKQAEEKAKEKEAAQDPNARRFAALREAGLQGSGHVREASEEDAFWLSAEQRYGKGIRAGRVLQATLLAAQSGERGPEGTVRMLNDVFGHKGLVEICERDFERRQTELTGMRKDLSSVVPSGGGYLIPEVLLGDLIELLYAGTPIFELGCREVDMPNGNMTLPSVASGATSSYVGESEAPNATSPEFGARTWTAKKLITVVAIPNNLIRSASLNAAAIIRDDAVRAMTVKLQNTAINGSGSGNSPLGLKGQTGLTDVPVNALVTETVPSLFMKALMDANVPMDGRPRIGHLFNNTIWHALYNLQTVTGHFHFKEEMDKGLLVGKPFRTSTQIANGSSGHNVTDWFFGDWAEYWFARQGAMLIDSSPVAAYKNSSGNVAAAYSQDETILRCIDLHDFNMRQAAAMTHSDDVWTV